MKHIAVLMVLALILSIPSLLSAGEPAPVASDGDNVGSSLLPGKAAQTIMGGDINANTIAFDVGDAIMFANYFLVGLSAFEPHIEHSIAMSDINGDGLVLTVADFVLLNRIVVGDTLPDPPPPAPDESAPSQIDGLR